MIQFHIHSEAENQLRAHLHARIIGTYSAIYLGGLVKDSLNFLDFYIKMKYQIHIIMFEDNKKY